MQLRLSSATALLALIALSLTAFGQIKSATITGAVADNTGAAIPGAVITVTNEETTVGQQVTANDAGDYTMPYLAPGRYTVEVRHAGFNIYKRTGVALGVNETVRVDAKLTISAVSEVIEVQGGTALQTETSEVQNAVGENLIQSAPNPNQNPYYWASLQPGVIGRAAFEDTQSVEAMGIGIDARRAMSAFAVNGGQAFANDIQLNGLSVQGSAWNEASVLPNQDSLQEVRTQVNKFSAEYGRGQGVVQLTTKSGGNQYHGGLNYRFRNDALNANTFGRNARDLEINPFKSHDYGGTFGGPIWLPKKVFGPAAFDGHNKAFFFVSYSGLYHNRGITFLRTVPTARERIGDFSETYVPVNGQPVKIRLWDPFVVTPVAGQTNQFRRAEIPNARLDLYRRANGSPGVDPFALKLMSFYPLPNRAPEGTGDQILQNINNYRREDIQQFRRNNVDARLDFKVRKHSLYSTFGITRGQITTPRTWGSDNPFYAQNSFIGNVNNDNNPYIQIGDTVVLGNSLVLDLRYGINRINSNNEADTFDNFDYLQFGVPSSLLALNGAPGAPPQFDPGERYSALNASNSLHKRERQTNHTIAASLTKSLGRWTLKAGGEGRVYLSNYIDPEESFWIQTDPLYTREIINATGGAAGAGVNASNDGFGPASFLLGGGFIAIAEGRSVRLGLAQKYLAFYSQNDWRVNNRLTLNLGARWDFQPGPTERYNQISGVDFSRKNPFGTQGLIVFPGAQGEGRNLWKNRYDEFAPRVGFAWRVKEDTVVRGGYGLTYLPSNTGYFDGTFNYGSATFSKFLISQPYGLTPRGVLVGKYYEVNSVAGGEGAQLDAPSSYGAGTPRFDYQDYQAGAVQQWNLFIERRVGKNWQASIGYTGTKGDHLPFSSVAANNDQFIDPAILTSWRNTFIANGGNNNPANDQIANPFQPNPANLIPFKGNLGRTTLSRRETLLPYPHLGTLNTKRAFGFSNYHALQLQVNRRLAQGLMINAHYTWSKALEFGLSDAQNNQGYSQTGGAPSFNWRNLREGYRLSLSDTPHRFVASFTYDLPIGTKRWLKVGDGLVNTLIGGWRTSGVFTANSGVPLQITGAAGGSINARPDLVEGVPLELPKNLQGWYDGNTTITLPSGRQYRPSAFSYLIYNPDAFRGRVLEFTNADGSKRYVNDVYWYGTAANTFDAIRSLPRWNVNLTLQKSFRLGEKVWLDFSAQATNAFNHTQWRPTGFGRDLGGQATTTTNGQIPGLGTGTAYGTHNTDTYEPRSVLLQLKLRF